MSYSAHLRESEMNRYLACKKHRESLGIMDDPMDEVEDCDNLPCRVGCPFKGDVEDE